jgi:hypothetical protein
MPFLHIKKGKRNTTFFSFQIRIQRQVKNSILKSGVTLSLSFVIEHTSLFAKQSPLIICTPPPPRH